MLAKRKQQLNKMRRWELNKDTMLPAVDKVMTNHVIMTWERKKKALVEVTFHCDI